jgi:hypothetical protein
LGFESLSDEREQRASTELTWLWSIPSEAFSISSPLSGSDRGHQIWQPDKFKALSKPPNALSRQGAVTLAAFERSGIAVRLISVFFGFDLGSTPLVIFFVLGSFRWRLIKLLASGEPM